ncbi:MAG: flagellar protein FlaG [Marinospirillum sp.]|uniref:flagellar protein FlaG n=1 Tax=Marinospirillum sp. TaxID=2183934 RepID=UPI0019FD3DEC|nr:flagellar protein FlaG [Marinospirillum sp.]MBE0508142.1 flagellar protein FlaG [Marinospirillum sp.]
MTSEILNPSHVSTASAANLPGSQVNKTTGNSVSERPVDEAEKSAAATLEAKLLQLEQAKEHAAESKEQQQDQTSIKPLSAEELRDMLDEINSALYSQNRALKFELNDKTEDLVVRVMNTKTDEVIRQYPSEEVLALKARLMDGETQFFSTQVS